MLPPGVKKVLLVEDDSSLLAVLSLVVKSLGADCIAVTSYEGVVELGNSVDEIPLAFLDVNLGVGQKNGFDVFDWLKSRDYHGRIIFLTGHAKGHPDIAKAIEDRSAEVLEKPASIEAIERLIYEVA